jgi:hypothetical protein
MFIDEFLILNFIGILAFQFLQHRQVLQEFHWITCLIQGTPERINHAQVPDDPAFLLGAGSRCRQRRF